MLGLGYVGLPLAVAFAEAGLPTLGIETNEARVSLVREGLSYLRHFPGERVRRMVLEGLLRASSDEEDFGALDVAVIAVPTPLDPGGNPDLTLVVEVAEKLAAAPKPGRLVVLESTVYPFATERVLLPIFERVGLVLGRDFFLAFSPEREDPGNTSHPLTAVPKVIGGLDEASRVRAEQLYRLVFSHLVPVRDARTAETVKLFENVFRAVNVALVNELKQACGAMDVDVWEVLEAAATKPFGFMMFKPGPGVGGHCIPIDPHYLLYQARRCGAEMPLTELALELNSRAPGRVFEALEVALDARGCSLQGARVMLLGVAYKRDIEDVRESPALDLASRLEHAGATVCYHDPWVSHWARARGSPALVCSPLTASSLSEADAVILVTDHSGVDYELVRAYGRLIIDARGVFRGRFANVVPA